jgi:hypothetical protein
MTGHIKRFIKLLPFSSRFISWLRSLRRPTTRDVFHGMTTSEEQTYFRRYAEDDYSGSGEIVDLGCWLGSTTIPLAQGLRKNLNISTVRKRIHAYDLFVWYKWMDPYMYGCRQQYSPGDSYLQEYRARTKNYSDLIKIYPGDLQHIGWIGEPIEFLLVDAMKSWDTAAYIVENCYPHLLPGKSVLLHQDFKDYYTSWIHLIQYRLREYFTFEMDIPNSGSVVFRLNKQVDCDLKWLADLKSFSDHEVDEAFDYSMSLVGGKSSNIAAAKVMYFVHLNRIDEARRVLGDFMQRGFGQDSDNLAICESVLAEKETQI